MRVFLDIRTRVRRGARNGLAILAVACAGPAVAGIDHPITPDATGIWSRSNQKVLMYGVIATEIGGAFWLGGDDPLGHTFWESIDATAFGGATAEVSKHAFGRARPSQTSDPNEWFKGSCCHSFPSGEVTLQAAFVTPLIVNYAGEHPWVWALEALPAYDAIARVKSGAHWQTDVIAGWALGTGFGYWAAKRNSPLFLQVMPQGVAVGLHTRF